MFPTPPPPHITLGLANGTHTHIHTHMMQTVVTAMTTLHKSYAEDNAASCLVIGTENKDVYILDPAAFTFLTKVTIHLALPQLHATPTHYTSSLTTAAVRISAHIHFRFWCV